MLHLFCAFQNLIIDFIDNEEDIVMPTQNLIECSKNYSKTTESLSNFYRDKPNKGEGGQNNSVNYSIKYWKSFDYQTSITGRLQGINTEKEKVKIVVPVKHLSSFWRTLDISLFNCEISLILAWSENCVIASKATRDAVPAQGDNLAVAVVNNPTIVTDTKLYIPVVTLSTEDDIKLLEQLQKDLKEILNGINTDQKCLIKTKLAT